MPMISCFSRLFRSLSCCMCRGLSLNTLLVFQSFMHIATVVLCIVYLTGGVWVVGSTKMAGLPVTFTFALEAVTVDVNNGQVAPLNIQYTNSSDLYKSSFSLRIWIACTIATATIMFFITLLFGPLDHWKGCFIWLLKKFASLIHLVNVSTCNSLVWAGLVFHGYCDSIDKYADIDRKIGWTWALTPLTAIFGIATLFTMRAIQYNDHSAVAVDKKNKAKFTKLDDDEEIG